MTQPLQVDPSRLDKHAGHIAAVADKTAQAADAAKQVTPGGLDNAYGVLCQFFGQAIDTAGRLAQGVLQDTTDALRKTQESMSSASRQYTEQEDEAMEKLHEIGRAVEDVAVPVPGRGRPR
ncbi:type VII secretion target [Amycolatopsis sp.]|uniref:type VII secretion target n=1 Tax=Amycolatopsis sp. TaxID=37632 RepID=UPI002B803327|nr:type VII secretion target [Amycolatopsis sp.]HVV14123.1 type VII secretion target [Amycolatopsis sp.]